MNESYEREMKKSGKRLVCAGNRDLSPTSKVLEILFFALQNLHPCTKTNLNSLNKIEARSLDFSLVPSIYPRNGCCFFSIVHSSSISKTYVFYSKNFKPRY